MTGLETLHEQAPVVTTPRLPVATLVKSALVLAVAGGAIWTGTSGIVGVAWSDVGAVLSGVGLARLGLLTAIWFGGLVVYATVQAGSLPGLGVRRGLLLNLTGSAVSNLLPLGGALGTALNWRMVRGWGHSHQAFASYFVLTNLLDVLTKLVLPPLAVAGLVAVSTTVPGAVWTLAAGCCVALVLGLGVLALTTSGVHPPLGRLHGRWLSLWTHAAAVVEQTRGLLVDNWRRLLPGSVGYVAAQMLLLLLCLRTVGLDVSITTLAMAAAIERAASLVPITPAGAGFAELGTIAWLVASGLDPAPVVAGVLLYRLFLVALEIPVGCSMLTGWSWLRRRDTSPAPG